MFDLMYLANFYIELTSGRAIARERGTIFQSAGATEI